MAASANRSCCWVSGRPMLYVGPWAVTATLQAPTSAAASTLQSVDNEAFIGHPPRLNRIAVRCPRAAPEFLVFRHRRLHLPRIVCAARLEHGLAALPRPRELKTCEGHAADRL